MRPFLLPILAAALLPVAVNAADTAKQAVQVTKKDCQRLVSQVHEPSADVAYQPGVGPGGRAVAPADLPDSGNQMKVLPDVVKFDMTYNPVSGNRYGANTQMTTAAIEYDIGKNRITMNGQPIGEAQQRELAEACRKAGFR